jgi:hypothetical protein
MLQNAHGSDNLETIKPLLNAIIALRHPYLQYVPKMNVKPSPLLAKPDIDA